MTFILTQKYSFPEGLSAGSGKIGVRISPNKFIKKLFEHIDEPLVSTSANISGEENLRSIKEITEMFSDKVDLIIDSGNLPDSKGSTVLDLTAAPPEILREGDVGAGEIRKIIVGDS